MLQFFVIVIKCHYRTSSDRQGLPAKNITPTQTMSPCMQSPESHTPRPWYCLVLHGCMNLTTADNQLTDGPFPASLEIPGNFSCLQALKAKFQMSSISCDLLFESSAYINSGWKTIITLSIPLFHAKELVASTIDLASPVCLW